MSVTTERMSSELKRHSESLSRGTSRVIVTRRNGSRLLGSPSINNIAPRLNNPNVRSDWQMLKRFAEHHGFVVTSTTGDRHAPNSRHYRGLAIDVRTKGRDPRDVENFMRQARDAGIRVLDERTNVFNSPNWTNEHLHLDLSDDHTFNFSLGGDLGSILGAKLGQSIIPIPGIGGAIGGYLGGLLGNKVSGLFGKRRPAQAPVREVRPEPMITTGNAELYATGGAIDNNQTIPNVETQQQEQEPPKYKNYVHNSKETLLKLGYTERQILEANPNYKSINEIPLGRVISLPIQRIDYKDLQRDKKLAKYLKYSASDVYAVLDRENQELNIYNGDRLELLSVPAALSKSRSDKAEVNRAFDDSETTKGIYKVSPDFKGQPYETSFYMDDEKFDYGGSEKLVPTVRIPLSNKEYLSLTPDYHTMIQPLLDRDIDIHIEGTPKHKFTAYNLVNGSNERMQKRKNVVDGDLTLLSQGADPLKIRGLTSVYANAKDIMKSSSKTYDQLVSALVQTNMQNKNNNWDGAKTIENFDLSEFDITNPYANSNNTSLALNLDMLDEIDDPKNAYPLSVMSKLNRNAF